MRRHQAITEEIREQAALYALGMLDPEQARVFSEHLAGGCEICKSEWRAFHETAARLPAALPIAGPPLGLRAAVLTQFKTETSEAKEAPLHVVRSDEGAWEPTGVDGVSVKKLDADPQHDRATFLVRMAPGASYPGHRHAGVEQCYVLEGDLHFGDLAFYAGDYQSAAARSTHSISYTVNGCLLLIVSSPHDEVIA